MSKYLAVVKYELGVPQAQKIAALKEGIENCALMLLEDFDVSSSEIEDVLDEALNSVIESEMGMES